MLAYTTSSIQYSGFWDKLLMKYNKIKVYLEMIKDIIMWYWNVQLLIKINKFVSWNYFMVFQVK